MAYDVAQDLPFMFADLPGGAAVTLGNEVASGAFDYANVMEQDHDGSEIQVTRPVLVLKRGALTDLARGVTLDITPAGQETESYKVREIQRIDDGNVLQLILVPLES